jgi:hypothetical protein
MPNNVVKSFRHADLLASRRYPAQLGLIKINSQKQEDHPHTEIEDTDGAEQLRIMFSLTPKIIHPNKPLPKRSRQKRFRQLMKSEERS